MCGIAGALVFNNSNYVVETDYINKIRDTMIHRGPDGGATWISEDKKIALAHRRLSIIDLSSAATQPMSNEDNTIFITFNGEIYNHAKIRKELEKTGKHTFKTDHSDTEVIIHAFEEWGIKCIDRLRGMFAFAIWDSRKHELWLARDRMGIKPLYYSIHDGRFVFASEIKALLEDPQQERKVDEKALYDYLSFLVCPAPNTMFEGIKKLSCSTYIKIDRQGTLKEEKYWDMLDYKKDINNWSEEKIAENLLKELKFSVDLRKESDVPVGVFLSGGIDSSTNAALFSKQGRLPLKTFTIGYEGRLRTYQNENAQAKEMAKLINAEYYEKMVSEHDIIDFLPQMARALDEPLADPVAVSQYYVSKLAKEQGVTVCQIGEGSDELFSGYSDWGMKRKYQQLSMLWFPKSVREKIIAFLMKFNLDENIKEFLRRFSEGQPSFWSSNDAFTEPEKIKILSVRMQNKFKDYTTWEAVKQEYERFKKKAKEKTALNWMTYRDLTMRLPDLLLTKVDKMGMQVSLEARVPFLDHKFVELAMNIPTKIKLRNNNPKYILKKAVKNIIPHEIINRKKIGFSLPFNEWMKSDLGNYIKENILYLCKKTDYFNGAQVAKLLTGNSFRQIWTLFVFALWWREYIDKEKN